jgi:hypothetical protein
VKSAWVRVGMPVSAMKPVNATPNGLRDLHALCFTARMGADRDAVWEEAKMVEQITLAF